ncbi:hypothetical protein TNCT_675831 [Trichonephila clavata]|uniref:Uncharacterized protein n=1 Tax=Trichonephila clavata TaxID=2740835 RepID=A0A8X6J0G7_TRICU|nr:hypothetical protein TNCT_675831 [Trichonephila clavata]
MKKYEIKDRNYIKKNQSVRINFGWNTGSRRYAKLGNQWDTTAAGCLARRKYVPKKTAAACLPTLSKPTLLRSASSATPLCQCLPRRSYSPWCEVSPNYSGGVLFLLRTSGVTILVSSAGTCGSSRNGQDCHRNDPQFIFEIRRTDAEQIHSFHCL